MDLKINTTPLMLRKNLGVLGISLPFILWFGNKFELQPSISHFYYTGMSVIFTGILFAFGLYLFSYRGYDKEEGEVISDNWATNLAGVLAILTALIPTTCVRQGCTAPNGHNNEILGMIHAIFAGGFFIIMGWMSLYKFTKGDASDPIKKKRNRLYRICGTIVWSIIAVLAIGMLLQLELTGFDVFIGETIVLVSFGIAWLVKSKALEKIGI